MFPNQKAIQSVNYSFFYFLQNIGKHDQSRPAKKCTQKSKMKIARFSNVTLHLVGTKNVVRSAKKLSPSYVQYNKHTPLSYNMNIVKTDRQRIHFKIGL